MSRPEKDVFGTASSLASGLNPGVCICGDTIGGVGICSNRFGGAGGRLTPPGNADVVEEKLTDTGGGVK